MKKSLHLTINDLDIKTKSNNETNEDIETETI